MTRLIIGLFLTALATPAAPQPAVEAEGRRLLAEAIAKAQQGGPRGFPLRCAAGCSRPTATLRTIRAEEVVRVTATPCRDRRADCYRVEVDAAAPPRWYIVEIEAREGVVRRVEILGP